MSSTSLWYATRASGIMALILFTLTMVLGLTTTTRARARRWPGFAQQEMHRRISMIAVVFLGIHVVTSVLDTYVNISWAAVVVPFTSSYGTFWVGVGAVALDLMLAVFVTSLLRARMRPGTWRAVALARLPELAGRPRPHLRHGHRLGPDVGDRARRRVCRLGRRRTGVAAAGRLPPGLRPDGGGVGRRSATEAPRAEWPGPGGGTPCIA